MMVLMVEMEKKNKNNHSSPITLFGTDLWVRFGACNL